MARVKIGLFRRATQRWRMMPSFFIIGAQKSGTSALLNALLQHPLIYCAKGKETDFMSFMWSKGFGWYRAHFPLYQSAMLNVIRKSPALKGQSPIACDASPSYLEHPLAPIRCREFFPDAKIIVILREPVARTYSGYKHSLRKNYIQASFEDALKREVGENLYSSACVMAKSGNELHYKRLHRLIFLARSQYSIHLKRWLDVFPLDSLLLLGNGELRNNCLETMNKAQRFLGLPRYDIQCGDYGFRPNSLRAVWRQWRTRNSVDVGCGEFGKALHKKLQDELSGEANVLKGMFGVSVEDIW